MSKIVFEREGGTWSAHDPAVPGVRGLGRSRGAARKDLRDALALMSKHEEGRGALDLVKKRLADIDAGRVKLISLEEAYRRRDRESPAKSEIVPDISAENAEDLPAAYESLAEIRAGGGVFTHEEMLTRYGLGPKPAAKIGVVSDIHGDIVALDAALGHLRRMGCAQILCPGDLLDIEPFSEEVVWRIKAEGVVCIRGNHERWALERRRRRPDPRKSAPSIVEPADLFTGGAKLSRDALIYLATLPASWSAEIAGVRVAMWHARPGSDMEGIRADATGPALRRRLLDSSGADVLIVGHTHDAFSLVAGKGRIVNPGACCSKTLAFKQEGALATPDGHRPATFGVLELPAKRFRVFQATDGAQVHEIAGSGVHPTPR